MRKLSLALVLALTLAFVVSVASIASAGAKPSRQVGSVSEGYPECTPYFSEGRGTICRLNKIHIQIRSCPFDRPSGSCGAEATTGSFPWGTSNTGANPHVYIRWNPSGTSRNGRNLEIDTLRDYPRSGYLSASIKGFVPGGGPDEPFLVNEAIAEGESTYPVGDHFYTPNLPGVRHGAPGGPLYLEWKGDYINLDGFLYLSR